jgi:hypothetical protein
MKTLFILFSAFVMVQLTNGQETVPLEEAQKAARKVAESAVADAPLKVDVDVDKPSAIKAEKGGLLIIPDKQLTAEKLTAAGAAIVPVGQLWSLRLSLATDGKAIGPDKLRMVTITDGDKQREVELYFLGAGKNDRGELELIVFGKDKESLFRVPFAKNSASTAQKLPIELSGKKNDEDSGTLTLHLVDNYTADLPVVRCTRE